jgi:hypothetical protein
MSFGQKTKTQFNREKALVAGSMGNTILGQFIQIKFQYILQTKYNLPDK